MSVRSATKAGAWYSLDPEALRRELNGHLGTVPEEGEARVLAAIVPHAGLAFSGPTAARVYAWVRRVQPAVDTFLVFGAVHTMHLSRPAVWAKGAWDTPLGEIPIDEALASRLVEAGVAEADEAPHRGDNAIELQTPFLKHCFPEAKLVPIATPALPAALAAGEKAWEVVQEQSGTVVVLGSTDLTHYGHSFGMVPAGEGPEAVAWSKENDRRFLDEVLNLNVEEILPVAARDRSACGAGAVAATASYARKGGCQGGVLLEHTTSHDVMPSGKASHFVGYGAVMFPAPDQVSDLSR